MLIPKIGGVAAHPANVHRLLYDERQLVLVFPEGRKGTEKLYKDRYRLRRFGRGGFVEAAIRAEAKLVPAVRGRGRGGGADLRPRARDAEAHRADLLPAHADVPLARAAGDARLPAGEVQDPLPRADRHGRARRRARPSTTRRWCRPSRRRSAPGSRRTCTRCWRSASRCGSDERELVGPPETRRVLLTGLSTYWGGRLAQALEGFEQIEAIVGGRLARADARARADRVRQGLQPALADPADRPRRRDRHGDRHPDDRQLARRPGARDAREQRHRDDEHPRGLHRLGLAGAQVRLQELDALLRLRAGRPGVLHRGE